MNTVELPKPTKKRLVELLQFLSSYKNEKVTSVVISEATGWSQSLIRHDLWLIGFSKGVSNGYKVSELSDAIKNSLSLKSSVLELKESKDAAVNPSVTKQTDSFQKNFCIAGLGRLGAALLDEGLFGNSIFNIKAGFDSNVNRVEILRSNYPLYPASEMQYIIKKEKIEYAILTVSDKDAQNISDRLISAGIKGIVNMTNMILKVPDSVKVENLSIINALNLVI